MNKRRCNTMAEVVEALNYNTEVLVGAIDDINIKIKKLKNKDFSVVTMSIIVGLMMGMCFIAQNQTINKLNEKISELNIKIKELENKKGD